LNNWDIYLSIAFSDPKLPLLSCKKKITHSIRLTKEEKETEREGHRQ